MNRDKENDMEQYLTTKQLMDLLQISRSSIHRLIAEGMPYIQVRGVNRFAKGQVLSWLEGDDEREQAKAILQEAQEILDKLEHKRIQGETTGQKR